LDKEIGQCIFDCNNLPAEIEVLESDLQTATEKQEQAERNKLLTAQKKSAEQVEELSKEFVEVLSKAVKMNSRLNSAYREYCRLHTLTKEFCISKNICLGSHGSLKYLFGICQKEISGERIFRQPMTTVPI